MNDIPSHPRLRIDLYRNNIIVYFHCKYILDCTTIARFPTFADRFRPTFLGES